MIRHIALAAGLSLALMAPARADDTTLTGVWESRTVYRHGLSGPLVLSHGAKGWRATVGGVQAAGKAVGDEVRFVFPGNGGQLRVENRGAVPRVYWLQSSGVSAERPYPGGSGQPFASPVTLAAAGKGAWRGVVRPLEDSFTLWLKIDRAADGSLTGAFRNPDNNSRGGAVSFQVSGHGDTVDFAAPADDGRPPITHTAKLEHATDGGPDRLTLDWQDLGVTLSLTHRKAADAAAFYPRPPGSAPYVYARPAQTGDGWETARARDAGMDEAALQALVRRLAAIDPTVRRAPMIHSVLVAHRGKLVLEEYFFGFDRETPHDVRSAGKTFASVMLGAAMQAGAPISPDTHVYDLMASRGPFANPDPRKARITVAQLMTHTAGLACDDNDDNSPGNEGTMQMQSAQPDWWKYALDLPMAYDPGKHYAYCSANLNLVGGAVATATHSWTPDYFDRTIAGPLQFRGWYWNLTPTGDGYQGGGAFLRPRDLLKVGQVFADGGVWHGRRIVSRDWVETSTAKRIEVSPETTGLTQVQFDNAYVPAEDGYAWHLSTLKTADGRTYRDYAATGNGGQLLIVVPDLDLVVVFTAGNYMQGGIWTRFRSEIVPNEIIPAIRAK